MRPIIINIFYSIVLELLQDSKLSFVEMSFSELTKKRASITFDDTIILDVDTYITEVI
jgi:hypothetical protein